MTFTKLGTSIIYVHIVGIQGHWFFWYILHSLCFAWMDVWMCFVRSEVIYHDMCAQNS